MPVPEGITLLPVSTVGEISRATRAITHLFVCKNPQFVPECMNIEVQTGFCYNILNSWNDAISSAGPDRETKCTLFADPGCVGRSVEFAYPGIGNLQDFDLDDLASSFSCT
ncbi:hypothetical protein DL98DRAFT_583737 [Cadophora sp. DSE1049]|nr:hypothetical protein DL98DRAFT_583737 [Cadophora sp. DSE1049]